MCIMGQLKYEEEDDDDDDDGKPGECWKNKEMQLFWRQKETEEKRTQSATIRTVVQFYFFCGLFHELFHKLFPN